MNSLGFIALITLSVVLSTSAYYYRVISPITLCMKSDYSWCTNVTYPNSCVNMDTVVMNSTGMTDSSGHDVSNGTVTAFHTIESVIVTDVDSTEEKCIVFYDSYNCQGESLVLNGTKHPSANLHEYKFSNKAESYRQCTDRVLTYLRDN
ncbi:uncharacterized protein LOC111034123 [Myzus persicae]|uniref:uncharacterized protein LOC111034123 n=1 Tax=Myzus persicae TaxID=13164 RepID=UPI000B931648|nr:uncharacterized protein LOC111034123 [Myzus persicae]